jgi:hypothetical protein
VPHKYLGVRGWCVLQFKLDRRRMSFKVFQYHGWSAGRLKGRKALQAERDLGAWNADAFFLGHDHQPYEDIFWTEEPYSSKRGWGLKQRPRAVINGGSWTYGQRPPTSDQTKRERKISDVPNEMWVEGRNFRPQPPESPVLLLHLDFGGVERPMGVSLETRRLATPRLFDAK